MKPFMCPQCGELFGTLRRGMIPEHYPPESRQKCPGTGQAPRNPASDLRPLWNGKPNPHVPAKPIAKIGDTIECTLNSFDPPKKLRAVLETEAAVKFANQLIAEESWQVAQKPGEQ